MLFLILWTEGDITSVIGVESQEPINGVITPFIINIHIFFTIDYLIGIRKLPKEFI